MSAREHKNEKKKFCSLSLRKVVLHMLGKPRSTGSSPRAVCCEHPVCQHPESSLAHAAKTDRAEKGFSGSPGLLLIKT